MDERMDKKEWKRTEKNVGNISFLDAHLFAVLGNGGHVWFHLIQFFLQDSYFILQNKNNTALISLHKSYSCEKIRPRLATATLLFGPTLNFGVLDTRKTTETSSVPSSKLTLLYLKEDLNSSTITPITYDMAFMSCGTHNGC